MKRFILAAMFVLLSVTSLNTNAADSPFARQEAALNLLLGSSGINGKVAYKVDAPDDYGKLKNIWLVVVTGSNKSDMDTLATVLTLTVSIDGSIPNKTHNIAVLQNGTLYMAPMPETRSCIKGVGIKGFACAKKHIRAGKI